MVRKTIQLLILGAFSLGLSAVSAAPGLDEIPAETRAKVYNPKLMDPAQPLGPSAFRDWKSPRKPPWTIGYASTYAGNTWRKGAMKRLLSEVLPKWQKLGLVKDIIITQSNLKDALQIQQMRQLVDQGVDAIIICCSNPTALNQTIKYAFDKGVPTFSFTGYVTSPLAAAARCACGRGWAAGRPTSGRSARSDRPTRQGRPHAARRCRRT